MKNAILLAILAAVAGFSQQPPKFDIADVHVSTTAHGTFAQNFGGVVREGRYVNRDANMLQLIESAWGLPEDGISGGPGWISLDLFDVVAKVPGGTNPAVANLMLQNLLADRFGLVVSPGTHPVPRYVLTVVKGGPKLKSASGSDEPGCKVMPPTGKFIPGDPASIPNMRITCHDLTSAAIAENLKRFSGGYVDHDVIDSTGIEDKWDFDLEWTGRGAVAMKGSSSILFFSALEKQLGLKLELQNVSLPSLAIEKVNRKPSPNPAGIEKFLPVTAPQFEAASIKLADPAKPPFRGILYTGGTQMHAGGTLHELITMALQISPNLAADTVIGLPKSADDLHWDIIAKMPETGEGASHLAGDRREPPPASIALEMLHGLLVDSFELKTHTENRELTVYALTLAGKKPKMTQADDSERSGCRNDNDAPKPAPNVPIMTVCKNISMEELADTITQRANAYIDHPIVDGTGLRGGWDLVMGWTPKAMMQLRPAPPPPSGASGIIAAPAPPNGLTVFEAMEQELGLKLVKQKRTVPVIVVDHADEKPLD